MKKPKSKFGQGEAIVFAPSWMTPRYKDHPLKVGEVVYFLSDIPNCPGHCIVAKWNGLVVPMVHPEDFRKATEEEL
jgi:hypothetical protein